MRSRSLGKAELWLIAVIGILPIAGSFLLYKFWQPPRQVNFGELMQPRPLPEFALATVDGQPFRLSGLKGRWIMLSIDQAECDAACRAKLWTIRQVRLAQGKEQDRIERVWLIEGDGQPDTSLRAEHKGAWIVRGKSDAIAALLPAQKSLRESIFLIDPLGNLMMLYRHDADPSGIKRDLIRLLKISRVG